METSDLSGYDDEALQEILESAQAELARREKITKSLLGLHKSINETVVQAKSVASLANSSWVDVFSRALPDELTDYIALGNLSPAAASKIWAQPAAPQLGYARGDAVIYEGKIYKSLVDENFFSPLAAPNDWEERS